jgi:hypothetical protein
MEKEFTERESLAVITEMINKSRYRLNESAFDFTLWGLAAFLAVSGQLILLQFEATQAYSWYTWSIMAFVGIASGIYNHSKGKKKGYSSHVDHMMGYLWGAFVVFLFLILINGPKMGWNVAYTLIIALYGVGTFCSGGLLKFNPLIWGGVSAWILAIVATYFSYKTDSFEITLILLALSIISSYLIPAYFLTKSKDHV